MKTKTENVSLFFNRELSWCEFNSRVLQEAEDSTTPLLERFRFAAIVAANFDEFFMVRVAGLKHDISAGNAVRCPTGMSPSEILQQVSEKVRDITGRLYETIQTQLLPEAEKQNVLIRRMDEISSDQLQYLSNEFESEIFPVLTPMAVDPTHPFPALVNLSLNAGVLLEAPWGEEQKRVAIVPIPSVLSRLWPLPGPDHHFVLLEDLIQHFLPELFTGQKISETTIFRVTRDAEMEVDDDANTSLLDAMEKELIKRRTNKYVRLEIENRASVEIREMFLRLLAVDKQDVFEVASFLDPRCLATLADLTGFDRFRYRPLPPVYPPGLVDRTDMWSVLRERDILLHHPYESFEPVVQLIAEAAKDPDVLAVKQTLYRTSGNSPVIAGLIRAAEAGKQVTVLVELTARFDEDRNIEWAKTLEKAGAHVIYGVVGLKTHAKILLIVRREKDGIRRYVHLGTGNYNDKTARVYTDIGLLTSDEDIGTDASGFFNTVTGYSDPPDFKKLTMAPLGLRERFLHLVHRERMRAEAGQRAAISAKVNSLVDPAIINALYEASQAGVHIRLAVRGVCCLRPKMKGVSDRISVVSIVDRFLEHSRVFYFFNGGEEEYYCSSADWMPRNLDRRVELLFPIQSDDSRKKLKNLFDTVFSDNVKARILQPDGSYIFRKRRKNEEPLRSQEIFYLNSVEQQQASRTLLFTPRQSQ